MAKSQSLEFNYLFQDEMQYAIVNFESESPERNLLMRVQLGNYSLDTPDLRNDHPKIYAEITNLMKLEANVFWAKVLVN